MRGVRIFVVFLFCCILYVAPSGASASNYESGRSLGQTAAERAAELLEEQWDNREVIVMTNAGYARPGGVSSKGCLDGLAAETGASVGNSTLLNLQSRIDHPLWFAFYSLQSQMCVYLQAEQDRAEDALTGQKAGEESFSLEQTARINSKYLIEHAQDFQSRIEDGLFGDNLFRVVTCANAVANNCPDDLLTAIQTHDHYCPGVTSGVFMARFIREQILSGNSERNCFILGLDPWCKEDALITLLNATPGKRGYGVLYPAEDATASWPEPLDKTSTVVFLQKDSGPWQGRMLEFDFAKVKEKFSGPQSGNSIVDKLAMDIWLIRYLDQPEVFVSELGTVELRDGMSPKELLRPGKNPVEILAGSESDN